MQSSTGFHNSTHLLQVIKASAKLIQNMYSILNIRKGIYTVRKNVKIKKAVDLVLLLFNYFLSRSGLATDLN